MRNLLFCPPLRTALVGAGSKPAHHGVLMPLEMCIAHIFCPPLKPARLGAWASPPHSLGAQASRPHAALRPITNARASPLPTRLGARTSPPHAAQPHHECVGISPA
jgi:hypothetical protein